MSQELLLKVLQRVQALGPETLAYLLTNRPPDREEWSGFLNDYEAFTAEGFPSDVFPPEALEDMKTFLGDVNYGAYNDGPGSGRYPEAGRLVSGTGAGAG